VRCKEQSGSVQTNRRDRPHKAFRHTVSPDN